MTHHTTRRTLLRAAPALLAPSLLATPAVAEETGDVRLTPILRLFSGWDELQVIINETERGLSDRDLDALCDALRKIESAIMAEPVTCVADLAAKIICDTNYGEESLSSGVIAADCKAILAGGAA